MHAHIEPFCGASGDMLLGALVDAGLALTQLKADIATLRLPELAVAAERVDQAGIAATRISIAAPEQRTHRHLPDILDILRASTLPAPVRSRAEAVFQVLAEAEARVHDVPVEQVHFHEVGALDAIADVVGVVAGLARLGVTTLSCRALPVSHGTVRCAHGLLPVPAPAVLRLMDGLPTEPLDVSGETVTPTAAALLRVLVDSWAPAPAMRITGQGYGAGTREFPRANVLCLMLGEREPGLTADTLVLLSSNIDDMNPEWLPGVLERLLAGGARDAWLTPILMKKGRPAHTLNVLADPMRSAQLRRLMLTHTSTLGVREQTVARHSLPRESATVTTPWGTVRMKVATLPDGTRRAAPEYEDCRALSESAEVPMADVYAAAAAAWAATAP